MALISQDGWRFCDKCQGLFFGDYLSGQTTVCPAGGRHTGLVSYIYRLDDGVGSPLQDNWRLCNRCQGLFFSGNPTTGSCPAGGGHNYSASANYHLNLGAAGESQE